MPNAVERVEEFLKAYGMSPSFTDVDACARAFQRDMERGLQGAKDAWMMMLPTYLSLEGEVPEEEPTIVIDAGGTNFRIGLVTVHPEGPEVEDLSVFPMPGSQSAITWAEFIEQVSDAILPLTDRSRRVGLCFSYAAESLPNRDGRVLGIAKQVRIVGFEGMELGRDLSAALEAKGAAGVRFVVLNDTVAALLGGVAELRDEVFDGYVGLIYGTGVNTCYAERPERLKRVTTPWEKGDMLVNMESARFDGGCQGEFDRQLDQASVDPGMCHYEKMVSGRYQGEVVYRTLRQGAMDGLFTPGSSQRLLELDGLTMVQADAFCADPMEMGCWPVYARKRRTGRWSIPSSIAWWNARPVWCAPTWRESCSRPVRVCGSIGPPVSWRRGPPSTKDICSGASWSGCAPNISPDGWADIMPSGRWRMQI